MPVRTRLGGWLLSYNQENADPAEADWIETKGRRLSRIYITHGPGDHWLGLARLIQRFPGAIGLATAEVLAQAADPAWPATGKRSSLARFPGPERKGADASRAGCPARGSGGLW
jgi:glyoxylase-like metal-dependent hydrolase (beta-lactamase superfamily II)